MRTHTPPFRLKEIKIEVTHRCHLACVHCSSLASNVSNLQISFNDCRRILYEASALGVSEVAFSGGEPLLWPHLTEVIILSRKLNFHTSVYTAGFIGNSENIISDLKTVDANKLIFSLYSADSAIHDSITCVEGAHSKTVSAIQEAVSAGINTELHFVPMSSNFRGRPACSLHIPCEASP